MGTVFIHHGNDVVWSQTGSESNPVSVELGEMVKLKKGLTDCDVYYTDDVLTPQLAKKMKIGAGGYYLPEDINQEREDKLRTAKRFYEAVCAGDDPETGQSIYVDCEVNGTTYRMNAGRNAADTFDKGLRLAQQNGETHTFVVDFYNQVHEDVPIADAFAINLQQSLDARTHYIEYQVMKGQLAAAQTVAEVRSIPLEFSINV